MENIYGELEEFLDEINTHISQTPTGGATTLDDNQRDTSIVVSALYDIVSWAKQQPNLYQVFYLMHTLYASAMYLLINIVSVNMTLQLVALVLY